jgi:hypothetical protein
LNLDIEGADFEVLYDLLGDGLRLHAADQPVSAPRIVRQLRRLAPAGCDVAARERWNFTLVVREGCYR